MSQPPTSPRVDGSGERGRSGSMIGQNRSYPAPLGYDPAKPVGQQPRKDADNKNIDLPPEAYAMNPLDHQFPRRPGFNESGKAVMVEVNQFRVKSIDLTKKIYQYDIALSPMPTKPDVVFKKCWETNQLKGELARYKVKWLYDGRKLAWAPVLIDRGEVRLTIDLDEGRQVKPEREGKNKFLMIIRKSKEIRLSTLRAYLIGQLGWDDSILECMNFLDHLLRQYPAERLIAIKRNFFHPNSTMTELGSFVSVTKGAYASIRMNQSIHQGGLGLGINVDVCNTAFWTGGMNLIQMIVRYLAWCDRRWARLEPHDLASALAPVQDSQGRLSHSDAFKYLRKLHKLRFTVVHRGKGESVKEYQIFKFEFKEEYGPQGANSRNVKFEKDGKMVSVLDYFQATYGYALRYPNLPLLVTSRAGYFPIEVCQVKAWQRYPFKLDGDQTSKMIKFAVTRPEQRKKDIVNARDTLGWGEDPYLRQFGVQMDASFAKVPARILPNPEIAFSNGKINPGVSGKWNLQGKKFLEPNIEPLTGWAFVNLERATTMPALKEFAATFERIYAGHGGRIAQKPLIIDLSGERNIAEALRTAYREVMAKTNKCQLIFCTLKAKNSGAYERLKKSADCRLGILTQMVQGRQVESNSAQYHSNVCMKVNAKLGGSTCKVPHPNPSSSAPTFFPRPTMIIGADVSHAAPGSPIASMAAMTMSINKDATRYAAACETNGHRVELLRAENIHSLLGRLLQVWKQNISQPPDHIYYLRDGVASSQYAQVLAFEVTEIKRFFESKNCRPRFTVLIATKRHRLRAFPIDANGGDRNRNPLPGCLIEREVTHPFHWDFILYSHVAIQGTARPVHYNVIMDEANSKPADLQKMLYQQCYQYIRSTTPVSLHPAVYYAHLACNRARYHEQIPTSEGFRSGGKAVEILNEKIAKGISVGDSERETESMPLMAMGGAEDATEENRKFIKSTMWYI